MVAVETPGRAEAPPRPHERRWASRWLLGTAGVLLVGGVGPLVAAPGVGHLSAAVLTLLLGLAGAAVALALGSPRRAFLLATTLVVLLDLGKLPMRAGPGYEQPEALWQTDQSIAASVAVPLTGARPSLAFLAQPAFAGAQPPYSVAASVDGRSLVWQCPFQPGLQWLELPVDPGVLAGTSTLEVRLRLIGSPSRERDYLLVYRSASRDGYLLSVGGADPSVSARVTTCAAA